MKIVARIVIALLSLTAVMPAQAERIKEIATLQGVRSNQLAGYGIVVGLDGTGDQTTQTPFTVSSIISMLGQMGINIPTGTSLQLKNVAAVMVTATLPPFAKGGQPIDVTVSSIGNAKSLRGGTLLMTPLKGADGQVYAMAQGNLVVAGAGAAAGGSSVQVNQLAVGRVPGGATVERAVPTALGQGEYVNYELNASDFTTAARMVDAINRNFGPGTAVAVDGRQIRVAAPLDNNQRVAFLSRVENLSVSPGEDIARVILNARTGSIVMNKEVSLDTVAVAHGSLSVIISSEPLVSQPNALSQGQTVATDQAQVEIKEKKGELVMLRSGATLGEVVKALNAVGATPQDLLAILQAMKAAGALKANLEII
ncbi:flagellar P-ring protein precursor FlgI [Novimethylophilus kurashikiensis]|uniref:Flagellar P-ring protein n=1 Tax=Novimethylophilus kurashikiensis TaxID=1825523 RepID=A0A2R5FIS4_9PROT|nr:flagellar basal body P-ring protein FlgI [Novimethylophilus kurashikiensis]GBG15821.1 flagellar P-ring protein precursor FlgI [Novimethylophilus kurashikiensis]